MATWARDSRHASIRLAWLSSSETISVSRSAIVPTSPTLAMYPDGKYRAAGARLCSAIASSRSAWRRVVPDRAREEADPQPDPRSASRAAPATRGSCASPR